MEFIIGQVKKRKELFKFLISGSLATAVDFFFVYLFFDILGIKIIVSAALAFLFAFFASFYLQKYWTFRDGSKSKMKKQMLQFFVLGLAGLVVNAFGMHILVEVLHVWYVFSLFLVVGGLAAVNFFVYKFVIFKKEHRALKKKILLSEDGGKKINLLIATGIYPPSSGGPATYAKYLKETLPQFGYRVKVVTYGNPEHQEKDLYIVNQKRNKILRYLDFFYYVWKLVLWADLVYVQGPVSEGLPSYLACRLRRKKYILKVVGDYAWEQSGRFSNTDLLDEFLTKKYSWPIELMRCIQKRVAAGAVLVITPSQYLKKVVSTWGIDPEKIKVIYNAVNPRQVAKIIKPQNEVWLVSNARLVVWKGLDTLIKLMPDFWEINENVKLKIIGAGPEKEKLEAELKKLKTHKQGHVKLLGQIPNSEALGFMKAADLFILNSGYEGLPHVVLECFHLGTPVMASASGGNPEIVLPERSGELFTYNNSEEIKRKIINFLQTGERHDAWLESEEGKKFMKQFDFSEMINNLRKEIEKICAS